MPRQDFEAVIGMEVHVQLKTASKMFCSCTTDYLGAPPNSRVCPVCLGMPGVLPVANRAAIEQVLKTALALNCEIPPHSKFDRKNYFYPDLPKGYQISQYDLPLAVTGSIDVDGRRVRIRRTHLEEDTGSLKHAGDALHTAQESLVDLNRSGVPLMEIVSEPDLHSAAEARDYGLALRRLLRWIGASEADMEKGQLRVEPNVSVRRKGTTELGVKTELKNLNSFRALFLAVEHEIERQVRVLEAGGQVVQETRGWSEPERRTFSQRSKEFAEDYRYFPEPDLPPLEIEAAWVEELQAQMPELPEWWEQRFRLSYELNDHQVTVLTDERWIAEYFDAVVQSTEVSSDRPLDLYRLLANWTVEEVLPRARGVDRGELWQRLAPDRLARLVGFVWSRHITRDQGREVLGQMWESGQEAGAIINERGLRADNVGGDLEGVVEQIVSENPQAVADYRAGKVQAIGALLGKARALTAGRADMAMLKRVLEDRLSHG